MTTVQDIADTYGLTMLDADKPIELIITPKDVRASTPFDQSDCAIARAIKRQYKARNVYVLRSTVWIDDGDHLVRYGLPGSLQKEIVSFDRSGDFRPGEYHLTRCKNAKRNRLQRAGKHPQREYHAKRRSPGFKPKKKVHRTEGIRSSDLDVRPGD